MTPASVSFRSDWLIKATNALNVRVSSPLPGRVRNWAARACPWPWSFRCEKLVEDIVFSCLRCHVGRREMVARVSLA
ncbi:hypothetical protein RBSWK_04531 [Rhodopirellula baltica SWK14]|uniref:Uncharacterized protein n=1 Tax=Rhodopirellula baltica SWK14 TaxID=993516 RepID=L7CC01_RHOBT|nr:hypothetical protein RBSWK_04531 [Rhodopirellula baltica SWK14]